MWHLLADPDFLRECFEKEMAAVARSVASAAVSASVAAVDTDSGGSAAESASAATTSKEQKGEAHAFNEERTEEVAKETNEAVDSFGTAGGRSVTLAALVADMRSTMGHRQALFSSAAPSTVRGDADCASSAEMQCDEAQRLEVEDTCLC